MCVDRASKICCEKWTYSTYILTISTPDLQGISALFPRPLATLLRSVVARLQKKKSLLSFFPPRKVVVCAECSATGGEQLQRVRLSPPSLPPSQSKSSVQKTCTFAWLIFRVGGGIGSGLEGRKKPIESCISVPVWELAFRFTYSSTFRYKYNPVCIYISQLGVSCEHMFKPTCLSPLWIWKTEHQLRYWKHDIPLWKASAAL